MATPSLQKPAPVHRLWDSQSRISGAWSPSAVCHYWVSSERVRFSQGSPIDCALDWTASVIIWQSTESVRVKPKRKDLTGGLGGESKSFDPGHHPLTNRSAEPQHRLSVFFIEISQRIWTQIMPGMWRIHSWIVRSVYWSRVSCVFIAQSFSAWCAALTTWRVWRRSAAPWVDYSRRSSTIWR